MDGIKKRSTTSHARITCLRIPQRREQKKYEKWVLTAFPSPAYLYIFCARERRENIHRREEEEEKKISIHFSHAPPPNPNPNPPSLCFPEFSLLRCGLSSSFILEGFQQQQWIYGGINLPQRGIEKKRGRGMRGHGKIKE